MTVESAVKKVQNVGNVERDSFSGIRNDRCNWLSKWYIPKARHIIDCLGIEHGTLLEVGGDGGWLSICLAELTDLAVVCTEMSDEDVEYTMGNFADFAILERAEVLKASVDQMPFPDGSFDYVVSSSSIRSWHNPQAGIEECYRVLKPGGRLLIEGFEDNCYRNFWEVFRDTGIPEFELSCNQNMTCLYVWKGRPGAEKEGRIMKTPPSEYRFDPSLLLSRHDDDWLEQIQPYAEHVIDILGMDKGTLLDVGCGCAGLDVCLALVSDMHFTCTDISKRGIDYAKDSALDCHLENRMEALIADAQKLPFDDDTFDFAMSTQSICGWHNPQKGIEEMYRVLKPGGRIFIRGFGDRYRDFWKILHDTGIPKYSMTQARDMAWISICK